VHFAVTACLSCCVDRAPGPTSCSQCEISRKRGAEDAKTIHELREETFAWKFQVLYGSENSEKFERTHTKVCTSDVVFRLALLMMLMVSAIVQRLHESIQELRRRLDHEVRQRQGYALRTVPSVEHVADMEHGIL